MRTIFCVIFILCLAGCNADVADQIHPLASGKWVDLTHDFSQETLFWPTSDTFRFDTVFAGYTDAGFYYEAYNIYTAEHGGTHLDSPIHFAEGKRGVHELPLENLIGEAAVIDVSSRALEDRNYQISIEDITTWEEEHQRSVDDMIILVNTGYAQFWPDAEQYMGTAQRGEAGVAELRFPGLHPDAARWLVENRSIRAFGLDTPSIDYGMSEQFETHRILFQENIPAFENVANLDQLPSAGAWVIALPMKIRHGSGAPLRIVAHVPEAEQD